MLAEVLVKSIVIVFLTMMTKLHSYSTLQRSVIENVTAAFRQTKGGRKAAMLEKNNH